MSNRINIEFSIFSDPYFLRVMDLSSWGEIEDEPSIIEITLPSYKKCTTLYFDKKKTNVYNSTLLGINCSDECGDTENLTLPDGIYTIKVTGSPDTFNKERYYLKTDMLLMEIDKVYIDNINVKNNSDLIDKLTEVEYLLKGAEAHLRFNDNTTAGLLFEKASDMVSDMKNCKGCK